MEKLLAKRKEDSHKGSYGKIAIIAGSRGMTGSAYLSCQAALRTGSGLVYALVAQSLEAIMSIKLTEAIIKGLEDKGKGHLVKESIDGILRETSNMDALAIGPGIGVDRERVDLLRELIKSAEASMVIDADGLNCLSKDMDMLKDKKTSVIITPHPGEMGRMLNLETQEIESKREYHAQTLSEKYDVITILKGHKTIVACPQGQIYTNLTGNPGMATAGSGDVLTGILASLLGQGLEPYQAARLGVYLHGLAGDIARDKKGEYGMIASDIVEAIPYAIMEIGKK